LVRIENCGEISVVGRLEKILKKDTVFLFKSSSNDK
jgi:hypothetical protein